MNNNTYYTITDIYTFLRFNFNQKRSINYPSQCEAVTNQSEKKVLKKSHASSEPVCDFCQLSVLSNPAGLPEMLLCCKDCTARGIDMNYKKRI